ncbi:MAG: adenine phosphoribosyltransferase [Actinomycetota bacterium]
MEVTDRGRGAIDAIESVFGRRRVLLPVIHVESLEQALRNAAIAREAGCDGVFLINHAIESERLLAIERLLARKFPGWWVGVNCLDLDPTEVFAAVGDLVDGVWVDNGLVDERREEQPEAEAVAAARAESGWSGLYFAGTAFKYQRHVEDLGSAARRASRYCDVVTTSGPGTGRAATVEKILAMKQALGRLPLAIASGITPDNIGDYLPAADAFLVATGVSAGFTEFDPALVGKVMRRIGEYLNGTDAAEDWSTV